MLNNDILRRIRYTFNFDDWTMMNMFKLADSEATREQISDWLKKEDDPDYKPMNDMLMATFLNGLINLKRGKREGEQPKPEKKLTNNLVLVKLKIALNLKAEDVIDILKLADINLSKHELSSFFRKPDHKNFRQCKDQILRKFLSGMQKKYRDLT